MNEKDIEFCIPQSFLDKLYEFTGSTDKYKGFIIAYCNEKGLPTIYNEAESAVVEMGLRKALETYLSQISQNNK